jgi:hypothetical protein
LVLKMNRISKFFLWCIACVVFMVTAVGCSGQSDAEKEFERQIRTPKGTPTPEVQRAMEKAMEKARADMNKPSQPSGASAPR